MMAKFISKSQMEWGKEGCTFGSEGADELGRRYVVI